MQPHTWTIEYVLENKKACQDHLEKFASCANIPLLNNIANYAVPNSSLVRFRGMIQDMLDPEFYLEKYAVSGPADSVRLQDGRYRDMIVYQNVSFSFARSSLMLAIYNIPVDHYTGCRDVAGRAQGECAR